MPIRARVLVALLVVALVAPLALAQVTPPVRLTAANAQAEALPGTTASLEVRANNTGPLPLTVTFETGGLPPGWTAQVEPAQLTLAAGAEDKTTLIAYVPDDAQPGTSVNITLLARDDLGNAASDPLTLRVTVGTPPPPPATPTPKLSLSISATSGEAGTDVESILTLLSGDASRLTVTLGVTPNAWNPRFKDGITVYAVDPGVPVQVRVRATVPATAAPDDKQTFTITATTGGFAFTVPWEVTALPSTAPAPSAATQDEGDEGATTREPSGDASDPSTPTIIGLEMATAVGELGLAPGKQGTTTLLLRNTGTIPLSLDLRVAPPAADWGVRLEVAHVDLAPGADARVGIEVQAPTGVPPQGVATIDVQAIDGSLVKRATLAVRILPGESIPRDETNAAAIEAPAPVDGDGLLSGVSATAWLALGVGTVGAGALVLANRPVREKLLWASVGLYTRLAQPDILGHAERDRLYKIIEAQPGIHFHALQRDLAWNTGTLTYHLRVLERHQFVVSRRDGNYRRFFKVGAAPRKELFSPDAPQGLRADVLEAIRNAHGISQSDLALGLGANKQTVNYHVKALERQGIIRVERRGRETFLYPHEPHLGPAGPSEARV